MKIKEGEPIPEGWIKGRWCNFSKEALKKISETSKNSAWYFNPNTNEIKHTKLSLDEEQKLLSSGWFKGKRQKYTNYESKKDFKYRIYTNDGINHLKISNNEVIPDGYVSVVVWRKTHPKVKKTKEEIKELYQKWVSDNIPKWKQMYLWYIEHDKDFKGMCEKFGYDKGEANFTYLIRKYIPEIYHFDTRNYKNPRPKTRGPYKKKNN